MKTWRSRMLWSEVENAKEGQVAEDKHEAGEM